MEWICNKTRALFCGRLEDETPLPLITCKGYFFLLLLYNVLGDNMKFIHMADLHLGRIFSGIKNSNISKNRGEDLWACLSEIIDICNEKEVDLLLIAGDLFERDFFRFKEVSRLKSIFSRCRSRIVISPGNHDYMDSTSPYHILDELENVFIFKDFNLSYFDFRDINTRVHGFSWERPHYTSFYDFKDLNIRDGYTNILLCHGSVMRQGEYLPLNISNHSELDYVALGHIHKASKLTSKMYYCGSPIGLSFKESGEKGVLLYDNGKVESILIGSREFNSVEISVTGKDFDTVVNEIKRSIKNRNALNRITLTGSGDGFNFIENHFKDYYYVDFIDNTTTPYDYENIYREYSGTIIGDYIEKCSELNIEDEKKWKILEYGMRVLSK